MDTKRVIESIKEKRSQYKTHQEALNKINLEKDELNKSLTEKLNQKQEYEELIKTIKIILEKLTLTNIVKLEKFLAYGMQQIFTDRHYDIKLLLKEDTKRPGIEIVLLENGKEQEITDSVGGGILSTLGLLAQIYYVEIYGINKIMLIDEGLAAVSKSDEETSESINYLNNVLMFLKYLASKRGYKFVIVTHETKVQQFADVVYKVNHGQLSLVAD